MGSTCAGTQYSTPRSRFVKPYVEAPRQVIGFDLSPKGGKPAVVPDTNDDNESRGHPSAAVRSNCTSPCSTVSSTDRRSKSTSTTSPRSALQQLLLPPLSQSHLPTSSPAANEINLTHGPLLESIPAANLNWPIFKGIPELVTPSRRATSINERKNVGSSTGGAVSANKCLAGDGKNSFHAEETIHELTWRSQRYNVKNSRKLEDQLHELPPFEDKSKRSIWKEAEQPQSPGIEIRWKQANMSVLEKSKTSSLFVLASSTPTAEYCKHNHLHGNKENSSCNMDMEFLKSCYLCKRLLGQGHDIFMYSGDKGFCSMECRYQQIVMDERKERHAPLVIRSGASPIYQGYMDTASAAVRTTVATATTHRPITNNRPNFMNSAAAA